MFWQHHVDEWCREELSDDLVVDAVELVAVGLYLSVHCHVVQHGVVDGIVLVDAIIVDVRSLAVGRLGLSLEAVSVEQPVRQLAVSVEPSQQIEFVPIDALAEATPRAYDWSDKLIEYQRDVPKRISFRIGDYARRNIVRYKDDDAEKYPNHSEAVLGIDDDTLDREKVVVEFPWAATSGQKITQYELIVDTDNGTTEAEFTQVEYRIMRITEWQRHSDCANVAEFKDLSAEYILSTYYNTYQAMLRRPRLITEHIRLNELEMRDIDFQIPVYLRKYGRFYAIKQIQWTVGDDYAEVELVQL